MPRVNVNTVGGSYPIVIARRGLEQPALRVGRWAGTGRVFVVYDAQVLALYREKLTTFFKAQRLETEELAIQATEAAKSNRVLHQLHTFLLEHGISRDDLIVACGGGVISDLVGFAAATILRGVLWAVIPTTLVGMVDAAIGGKTAINHPCGKNLIGAFWQPRFVLSDVRFLSTLPLRQMVCGLGEVAKYAGLSGGDMMKTLRCYLDGTDLHDMRKLTSLITLSSRYKADIVSEDEYDRGRRLVLNLGHTFAHAFERAGGYGRLLHGEAVVLGLLAANELSCLLKPARRRLLEGYRQLLLRLVPLLPRRKIAVHEVLAAMELDKKRWRRQMRFVLLKRPGSPFLQTGVDSRLVMQSVGSSLETFTRGED